MIRKEAMKLVNKNLNDLSDNDQEEEKKEQFRLHWLFEENWFKG